jgi:hypothetical protein
MGGVLFDGAIDQSIVNEFILNESLKFLLSVVSHIEGFLLQPFWQLYFRNWIRDSLEDGRYAHHLLHLGRQSLEVIVPIQNISDIHFSLQQSVVVGPT